MSTTSMTATDVVDTASSVRDNPFSFFEECRHDWDVLISEWISGPVANARTMEEVYSLVLMDNETRVSAALLQAWKSGGKDNSGEQKAAVVRYEFFSALGSDLGEGCTATDWVAEAIADLQADQWPMTLIANDNAIQPVPRDQVRAKAFINALLVSGVNRSEVFGDKE